MEGYDFATYGDIPNLARALSSAVVESFSKSRVLRFVEAAFLFMDPFSFGHDRDGCAFQLRPCRRPTRSRLVEEDSSPIDLDLGPLYLGSKCRSSIDSSRSFLIVQLRWIKIHNAVTNIVYSTVANYYSNLWYCSTR
jgi:hypothetical protein